MYHSLVYEHETSSNFDDGSSEYENKYTLAVGLSQICSKICPKCFWEFPKNFPYYA